MTSHNKQDLSVAVIMRTKNRPLLLGRALESAIGQTYPHLEIVIINDGGDPGPVEDVIAANKPFRKGHSVKVLHNTKSLGMEAASNFGIRNTDSEIIAILDDDDRWHEDYLSEAVSYLNSNGYKGVVTYSKLITEEIKEDKVVTVDEQPYLPSSSTISLFELLDRNTFPTNAFIYRRDAYKEIGKYDETLPVLGDWDYNIRFASVFEIGVLEKTLAYVHQRKLDDGNTGNTVVTSRALHLKQAQLLRNKYLRQDLASKSLGLGYLMNLLGDQAIGMVTEIDRLRSATETHLRHISGHMDNLSEAQTQRDSQIIALTQENLRILHENNKKLEKTLGRLIDRGRRVYRKVRPKRNQ